MDFPSNWTRPGATSRPSSPRSRAEPLTRSLQRYLLFVLRVTAEQVSEQQCRNVCCSTAQIMLRQPFNQRADVYSFGMVLWGIYTCKQLYPHHQCVLPAFLGVLTAVAFSQRLMTKTFYPACSDIATFTRAIVGGERPPIPDDCLPSLRELMQDCWQGDPERRYSLLFLSQSAPLLRALLRRVAVALTLAPSSCAWVGGCSRCQDPGSMRSTSDWTSF